jgi:hypothetical protein
VSADGVVDVDEDGDPLTLDGVRRLVDSAGRRRAQAVRQLEQNEPSEVRTAARPDDEELPTSRRVVDATLTSPGGGEPGELG